MKVKMTKSEVQCLGEFLKNSMVQESFHLAESAQIVEFLKSDNKKLIETYFQNLVLQEDVQSAVNERLKSGITKLHQATQQNFVDAERKLREKGEEEKIKQLKERKEKEEELYQKMMSENTGIITKLLGLARFYLKVQVWILGLMISGVGVFFTGYGAADAVRSRGGTYGVVGSVARGLRTDSDTQVSMGGGIAAILGGIAFIWTASKLVNWIISKADESSDSMIKDKAKKVADYLQQADAKLNSASQQKQ